VGKELQQETQDLTLLAQKTISTLQDIIDDKNNQIAKKDRLIEKKKQDFLEEKEKDAKEVRNLNKRIFEISS